MDPEARIACLEVLLGRALDWVEEARDPGTLHVCGPMAVPLPVPRVSIAGSMLPSARAAADACDIASCLAADGTVLVGGLERGTDSVSHRTAIACGGRMVAVLETPLDMGHPAANTAFRQEIMRPHLAVSRRAVWDDAAHDGPAVRNGIVAMLSHAVVITGARDSIAARHQAEAALGLGWPLFMCRKALEESSAWSKGLLGRGARVLSDPDEIFETLRSRERFVPLDRFMPAV